MAKRTIALPCDVGDTVYYINNYSGKIESTVVKYFTVTKKGITAMLKDFNTQFWNYHGWGRDVFASYEEAEEALKKEGEA